MRIKQSLCYPIYDLNGLSLDELFKIGAEIGYVAIEMWQRGDDLEEVVGLARKHNLAVASLCGHQSLADGLNKRSNHARIEDELKTSIDIAARHGIPGVICFSGNGSRTRRRWRPSKPWPTACGAWLLTPSARRST
jgi:hydroxypyruvate isomerase